MEDAVELLRADPQLRSVVDSVGPIELRSKRPYFWTLCRAILAQQVSSAAARTITARVQALYPEERHPRPHSILDTSSQRLREAGVSRQKARYLRALAEAFVHGSLKNVVFSKLDDVEVLDRLTQIVGIGRWTAEMFLIFSLRRPDVFPIDDLGIRRGMRTLFGSEQAEAAIQRAEPWRPFRTVACLYLWRAVSDLPPA